MVPSPPTPCTPRLRISASSARGTSATKHSPAISSGLVARIATIRHRTRSERTSSERRHGLPAVGTAPGTGGMWVPRKRLAARRSSRTSRRQAAAAPSRSGSPIQTTLSAAPSASASTEIAPRIGDRHVDDEVRRGVGRRAPGGGRARAPRSRTALHRHVARAAQRLDRERRVRRRVEAAHACGVPRRSRPRPGSGPAARTRAPSPASSAASAAVARTRRSRRCRRSPRAPAARTRRSRRCRCRRCAS